MIDEKLKELANLCYFSITIKVIDNEFGKGLFVCLNAKVITKFGVSLVEFTGDSEMEVVNRAILTLKILQNKVC